MVFSVVGVLVGVDFDLGATQPVMMQTSMTIPAIAARMFSFLIKIITNFQVFFSYSIMILVSIILYIYKRLAVIQYLRR